MKVRKPFPAPRGSSLHCAPRPVAGRGIFCFSESSTVDPFNDLKGACGSVLSARTGQFFPSLRGPSDAAPAEPIPECSSHDRYLSGSGAKEIHDRLQASVPETSAYRF